LNQYTQRDVPGAADIIGIAHASATVTVNGSSPYRKGEYFWKELSIDGRAIPCTMCCVEGVRWRPLQPTCKIKIRIDSAHQPTEQVGTAGRTILSHEYQHGFQWRDDFTAKKALYDGILPLCIPLVCDGFRIVMLNHAEDAITNLTKYNAYRLDAADSPGDAKYWDDLANTALSHAHSQSNLALQNAAALAACVSRHCSGCYGLDVMRTIGSLLPF
jgi:hypothetical protein